VTENENVNERLRRARDARDDEFYTQYSDIERELKYYESKFVGKRIYCNCDNPLESAFFRYFHLNFNRLGILSLKATHFVENGQGVCAKYTGECDRDVRVYLSEPLCGDGDFRSDECREILKSSDIVVTNPPFSLAREFIETLTTEGKLFLIVGALPWLGYSTVFPLIRDNRIWAGINDITEFIRPDGTFRHIGFGLWVTNLDNARRHRRLELQAQFSSEAYTKYDNFDAINVDKVADIPKDYFGVMGLTLPFLKQYNPEQFEIVGFRKGNDGKDLRVGERELFSRVLIRRKE